MQQRRRNKEKAENEEKIRKYVKASRPDWSRGQNFGLGLGLSLERLASAWPQSC